MDSRNLYETLQKISANTIDATNPTDVKVGRVMSVKPLKINVDQKFTITEKFIRVINELTDYETFITVNGKREKAIIHNSLKVGENVYLVRFQAGQKYLVIGRV